MSAARAGGATASPTSAFSSFARQVVTWQRSHGRSHLPWQNTRDPYRVWLSEIMLQQTQVSTVLGYYARFLERCPDVAALAQATEDEVFALWSGLGYYTRARNLHRAAQEVVARFGGVFPRTAAELETLPGIGRSTAAAIASFCFGERVAILDGNVKRVLARYLGFAHDLASARNERMLWDEASRLVPERGDDMPAYTQGLMDLGATVCLPRNPSCLVCPLNASCVARQQGRPEAYPVRTRKLKRTSESLWVLWAEDAQGRVFVHKRPAKGVWAGLYSLPVFADEASMLAALPARARERGQALPGFLHVLTHKDLHLHPWRVALAARETPVCEGEFRPMAEALALGLPAPVRKLLAASA